MSRRRTTTSSRSKIEPYEVALDRARAEWVTKVMEACKGNWALGQELSGMHRSNLRRLAEKLGLEWEDG